MGKPRKRKSDSAPTVGVCIQAAAAATKDSAVVRRLLEWYEEHGRSFPWREPGMQPWQVLVTEMLLRQTQSWRVAPFISEFFRDYPDPQSVLSAKRNELEQRLRPLGLHRTRARQIQAVAAYVVRHGGRLRDDLASIESIPGVGPYVAAAFAVAVFSARTPAVDGNILRLIGRFYGVSEPGPTAMAKRVREIVGKLLREAPDPRKLSWAMLDLAALACRPSAPRCAECPLHVLGCSWTGESHPASSPRTRSGASTSARSPSSETSSS